MSNPIPLGEALAVIIDHRGKTPRKLGGDFTAHGVPVVSAIHVKNGRIDWSQRERFVSESMFHKWMPVKLKKNDLLLTSEAPLGEVALVPDDRDLVLSQRLFALRGKPDVLHTPYLYYYFRTPQGQADLQSRASGSTVLGIRQSQLVKIELRLPPLIEQRRIAGVLGAFDDLLETNRQLINDCAALRKVLVSQALDDAKSNVALSATARFVNGKNFTRDATGVGRPIIRTPEVRGGVSTSTLRSSMQAADENLARSGDILMVWSGSLTLGRWMDEDALINQHVFKVIPTGYPDWLVYALVDRQMSWFLSLAADKATTMGHIRRVHLDVPVPVPSPGVVEVLDTQVRPLWDSELDLSVENHQLRRTRDELLPLLMSGAVRVSEVEDSVP